MPFTHPARSASRRSHRLALVAAATLALSAVPVDALSAAPATSLAESPPTAGVTLRLVTASAASVGDVVPVEVWADGLTGAAAFEMVASVSSDAARIVGASTDAALGRADMSIGDLTGFGVLAAYSPDGGAIDESMARLGTFDLRLDGEGRVVVELGAAMVVDRAGHELMVGDAAPVSIMVGTSLAPQPAQAMPWALSSRDAGTAAALPDADELSMDWQTARLDGDPCAGDIASAAGGCIDIGDVQRQVARESRTTQPTPTFRAGPYRLVVNARTDESDRNIGNGICATAGGVCTLRAAMQEADAITGKNLITFNIPGSAPYRIQTERRLPTLNDKTGRTTINGYTQPGAMHNTAKRVSNAKILIEVVGKGAAGHDGFALHTGGNVLRGLSIYAFRRPVWIFRTGADAKGNRILGNFIGTDPSGRYREPRQEDLAHGIHIEQGSPRTKIGGRKLSTRNVISGNGYHGIGLWHEGTVGTVIRNNIIGLSPLGDRRLQNWEHGIDMNFGVSGTRVGGRRPGQRNVISGNDFNGVEMSHRSATRNNRVIGNFIGTTVSGRSVTSWTGNRANAMWIEDGASNNLVVHNVMGGNRDGGIRIINNGTNGVSSNNTIRGNWIGISKKGKALPQGSVGILVQGASTMISENVIAHNSQGGVVVSGPDAMTNTLMQNLIHHNGGLAIDIAPFGVNPNDPGDADTGPNARLNFPELADATTTSVTGTACAGCRVEVFAAGEEGSVDPRHGPAFRYLGTAIAGSDGQFEVTFAAQPAGTWLSSTATNPAGSTSEMSANIQVPS